MTEVSCTSPRKVSGNAERYIPKPPEVINKNSGFSLQHLISVISADVLLSLTKTTVSAAASGALSAVSVFTADTDVKTSYGTQKN